MLQLTLQITDETTEQALFQLAQQQSKDMSDLVMMAIQDFITHNKTLHYEKLNPEEHSVVINYPVTEENVEDVKPFAEVKNAAHYVSTLRQNTWNRNI